MRNLLHDVLFGDVRGPLSDIVIALSVLIVAVVRFTKEEIDLAIEHARKRVGAELAELLEAPAMTEEEMDVVDQEDERWS